jgi:ATP-dependent Clp protease ATP-binding subunit ClpA
MNISLSVTIVWQLAAQEAIRSKSSQIEPDHYFLALLKFSELERNQLSDICQDSSDLDSIISEIGITAEILAKVVDNSKIARRTLRAKLPQGNSIQAEGPIHRSNSSRSLFAKAADLVNQQPDIDQLQVSHILTIILMSPTPAMTKFLSLQPVKPQILKRNTILFCERWGTDLLRSCDRHARIEDNKRNAEVIVLINVLSRPDKISSVLISNNTTDFDAVLSDLTEDIRCKIAPAELLCKSYVDIRNIETDKDPDYNADALLKALLNEAAIQSDLILISNISPFISRGHNNLELLKKMLESRSVHAVFLSTAAEYYALLELDKRWARRLHPIWINDGRDNYLPSKL